MIGIKLTLVKFLLIIAQKSNKNKRFIVDLIYWRTMNIFYFYWNHYPQFRSAFVDISQALEEIFILPNLVA